MVFRSIAVPIKAALGYLLSVGAAFGAVAAVFEWGWFGDALNVAKEGPVISFMPIILMGVLFGLAMDYEVFLVSRIREDYVHGGDARRAIESGFVGSAKVVTAAAIIMISVFAAFVPEGDTSIKPIALGLAVGVFVDAFIVRMTLVPAVLQLLGDKAWWMPRWLDRVLPSFDVEGDGLQKELELADWPEPGPSVHRRGGRPRGHRQEAAARSPTCRSASRDGDVLVVHGGDRTAASALLMAVTGRTQAGRRHDQGRRASCCRPAPQPCGRAPPSCGFGGTETPVDDVRRALTRASAAARARLPSTRVTDPVERRRIRVRAGRRVQPRPTRGPPVRARRQLRRPGRARRPAARRRRAEHRAARRARRPPQHASTPTAPPKRRPSDANTHRPAPPPASRSSRSSGCAPSKRVTWLTIAGILLVPLVIGGLLVWALWNPTERLGDVKAAVVNLDQPVTVNGQTVPLGRQLSAGLLDGKNDNFSWVLTDEKDAASGLADGSYVSVVTIPKDFSKAATSPRARRPTPPRRRSTCRPRAEVQARRPGDQPGGHQHGDLGAQQAAHLDLPRERLRRLQHAARPDRQGGGRRRPALGGVATLASGTHQLADAAGQLADRCRRAVVGHLAALERRLRARRGCELSTALRTSRRAGTLRATPPAPRADGATLRAPPAPRRAPAEGRPRGINAIMKRLRSRDHAGARRADLRASSAPSSTGLNTANAYAEGVAAGTATSSPAGMPALTGGIAAERRRQPPSSPPAHRSRPPEPRSSPPAHRSRPSGASQFVRRRRAAAATGSRRSPPAPTQSASGAASLATGLKQAAAQLPSYSKSDRTNLASVASEPVDAEDR